jgi:hypothetical protein
MRILPDSASLDHLRRQAKEQLAVLRRTRPEATLAEAQANLARQHGFESWAAMKADVERRRAANPETAADELAAALADAFGLGTPVGAMTHIERQWVGEVWELEASAGRATLTDLADYVVPDDIEVEATFVEAALAAGVLAPPPMRSSAGTFVVKVEGRCWRAHQVVPLGPLPPQPPPPEIAAEGGRVLARLHAMRVPAPKRVHPWLTMRSGERGWNDLLEQARKAERPWADQLERNIPGYLALHAIEDERDPDERAILSKGWHAPAGSRLASDGRLLLVGWDHTCAVPPDWDLGGSLMAWSETVDGDHDHDVARSFLDGYREVAGDGLPIERRMFTAGVTAALNWVISRVNIALNDTGEDQRLAERNVPILLANPLTVDSVDRLMAALG